MPILTAKVGTNADQFPDVLAIYAPEGSCILDMTYGRGVFWKRVDRSCYQVVTNDLSPAKDADYHEDFRHTSHADATFDMVVLDPPYAAHGTPMKASIDNCYEGGTLDVPMSSAGVRQLFADGIAEAHRLLKRGGILVLKVQDEIESGRQVWKHAEYLNVEGWRTEDLFVMVQSTIPAQRWLHQLHARKNHSYFVVLRKR